MADEDISLNEDQLLDNLDDGNNGDSEFLNEVRIYEYFKEKNHPFAISVIRKVLKRKIYRRAQQKGEKKNKMATTNTNEHRQYE